MRCWGLVPARGGSKSIVRKNLVPVAGYPLLDYGIRAAQASGRLDRIFCSTDDAEIAARARLLGVEIADRPVDLATDDAKVDRVAQAFLEAVPPGDRPDILVLVQPTSPFLLPSHVGDLIDAMAERPNAASAHNVTAVTHNLHAWNQRVLDESGQVTFLFAEQRKNARNKQEKPALFAFGNLIAARTSALLRGNGFYAAPVTATQVPSPYNFDLDTAADISLAETLLASGLIVLPHMRSTP